jgi:hypothetical protein
MGAIALVQLSVNQAISTGTLTKVSWGSVVHDEANFWADGNPTRLTVPPGITEVIVSAYAAFPNNGTGDRWIVIRYNDTTQVASMILPNSPVSDNDRIYAQTPVLKVTPGDFFEVQVWQASGGNLDLLAANTTFASIEALGEVAILTPPRLVKPARWAARGPRMQDNHLLQGCLALFPLWDGGGPDAIELMRFAGAAYHARWEVAPNWGVGRAGACTVHDGTDTVGLNVTGSFTALSKLKQPLPLTIEALVEPFASNPAEQGTIFCNDGTRSTRYRGIVLTQTAAGAFQLSYGDGTGDSSGDRRTFTGPSNFTQANRIYHVLATARGPTDGEICVNGAKLSVTTSGSGGAIAYGSDPARIGSQGGFSGFSARAAQGSVPPPAGDSGKGSIVIAIAC